MDVGSILLILGLATLVVIYLSRPFFSSTASLRLVAQRESDQHEHLRSSLMAEHERVLAALQELEFDHTLGKIPEEDYPAQRVALLKSGAATLRQLDELQPAGSSLTAEARIEAAVASRRADSARLPSTGPAADTSDSLENMIAARRRQREGNSAGFCPKCGKPVQKKDRFCPRCGTTVEL